jgi:hypothetical protein
MTIFSESLTRALQRMNKPQWFNSLMQLSTNFDQLPIEEIEFNHELLDLLANLINTLDTDDGTLLEGVPLETLAAIRLSKLNCWTLRAQNKLADGNHDTWNPLKQTFVGFRESGGDSGTKVFQASNAYPAEDIIKRWARDNLK